MNSSKNELWITEREKPETKAKAEPTSEYQRLNIETSRPTMDEIEKSNLNTKAGPD